MALIAAGAVVLVQAFAFRGEGVGTPAPLHRLRSLSLADCTAMYAQPLYLAVLAAIVGQALVLISQSCWPTPPASTVLPWLPSSMATKNRPG